MHAQSSSQNSSSKMASRVTAMLLATNAAFILLVMPVAIAHLVSFFPANGSVRVERSSGRCVSGDHAGLRAAKLFRQLLLVRFMQQEV